jgi:chitinase
MTLEEINKKLDEVLAEVRRVVIGLYGDLEHPNSGYINMTCKQLEQHDNRIRAIEERYKGLMRVVWAVVIMVALATVKAIWPLLSYIKP